MYLFYNLFTTLHVSKDHFVHHQEFMIYCICSSVQTMQTCLTTRSYGCNRCKAIYLETWCAWAHPAHPVRTPMPYITSHTQTLK